MPFARPAGAPLPLAPPCIQQTRFPLTAGDRQTGPRFVRALQRGAFNSLASLGSLGLSSKIEPSPYDVNVFVVMHMLELRVRSTT